MFVSNSFLGVYDTHVRLFYGDFKWVTELFLGKIRFLLQDVTFCRASNVLIEPGDDIHGFVECFSVDDQAGDLGASADCNQVFPCTGFHHGIACGDIESPLLNVVQHAAAEGAGRELVEYEIRHNQDGVMVSTC